MNMNIYITKDNEANLRKLEDYTMSGLINHLLYDYWKDHTPEKVQDYINKSLPEEDKRALREDPKQFESYEKPSSLRSVGANLCKIHNLPLTTYGKCLQKGCKYA